jgi:hypothetical protein
LASFHWAASVGVLIANQFRFKLHVTWSPFGWRKCLWIFWTGSDPTKVDCSCWETGGFSETSVNLYQTTWCYSSEDCSFEKWPWKIKISYK